MHSQNGISLLQSTVLIKFYFKLERIKLLAVWLGCTAGVCADTVTTRDGAILQGRIVLAADGTLLVGGEKVQLADVKQAQFEVPQKPEPITEGAKNDLQRVTAGLWAVDQSGALSWNGSFIARKVVAMDDTKVSFEGAPKGLFLSTINTAAVFFGKISLAHAFKLREQQRPGVLLASGDFVEGSLKSVINGTLLVDSVLFGRKSYAVGAEAVVLWLQKPKPVAAGFTFRTRDGSMILVKEPAFKDEALILNGSPFHNYRIARDELVEIRKGGATDVLTLAWAKVDNAPPEKKPILLATVENVGRILHLRKQVQMHEVNLQEAMKLLAQAEAARVTNDANRNRAKQDWKQLQNVWRQKNREYWKTHSNKLRMTSQTRVKKSAVDRAEKTLKNAQRTLEKYNRKLVAFEKENAQANAKPQKDVRRKKESLMRPIERAKRSMQSAQQKLDTARRDNEKVQAETKPLPAKEKIAKQTLDKAKKEIDHGMQTYRQSLTDYQLASREVSIARSRVSELQQKKDQAARELEERRFKAPVLPSNN